jgi:glycerol-1-phosphate dehydrogenase [NAD(P)+]
MIKVSYDPAIQESSPQTKPAYIKVKYGNGLSISSMNDLKNYTAVVANPPWDNMEKKLKRKPTNLILPKNVDEKFLDELAKNNQGHDIIVGIGGGVAIDAGKFLSWKWNLPYMRIPSIISVDAFLTKEVGVRNENRVRYIGCSEPNNIVIDYELIRSAPQKLNYAGTCDVLSICTALGDWKIAKEQFGDKFNQKIYDRAFKLAKDMLSKPEELKVLSDKGIKYLVDCLIAECYICADWGNARPEEGGEHHLAYCVERVSPKQYLHGSLVGLNMLVVLKLQGSNAAFTVEEVKDYFDRIGHEYKPKQIGIDRETYKKALLAISEYVKAEKLEHGLWYTQNPYKEASIEKILDWVFNL